MHHGEGCVQGAVSRVCAPWGGLCSVGCKQGVCTMGRVVFSGL